MCVSITRIIEQRNKFFFYENMFVRSCRCNLLAFSWTMSWESISKDKNKFHFSALATKHKQYQLSKQSPFSKKLLTHPFDEV